MVAGLNGIWDANETWLVLFGGVLFGAFPSVYALLLHALYIPIMAGCALGALISGLPVTDGEFSGNAWSWLSPFSFIVAVGVAAGYALLGGTYLTTRTQGEMQQTSRRWNLWAACTLTWCRRR